MTSYVLDTGETLHSYCKRTGVKYVTVAKRIEELGYSLQEALTVPPLKTRNVLKVNGELLKKVCKDSGVCYESVLVRSKRTGESLEDSFGYFKGRLPC